MTISALIAAPSAYALTIDSDLDGLKEIVVTANKQVETLQKAPEAITVLAGDALLFAGITDIRGAEDFVPSARFQQENTATEVYIRGVGSTLDFPQVSSPNVFNLNGISVPREATGAPLFDVNQIEVLPGPQGTLYGSSAMGGAINVSFRRPTFAWDSRGSLEVGDFNLYHVSVSENVPVSNTVAVRAAIDSLSHSGYQTSGADSQKDLAARLSVLYQPTDGVSMYLWGSSVSKEGHPPNLVPKGYQSGHRHIGTRSLSDVESVGRPISCAVQRISPLRPTAPRAAAIFKQNDRRPD
jgi:iron complex outermembrane receptor protein